MRSGEAVRSAVRQTVASQTAGCTAMDSRFWFTYQLRAYAVKRIRGVQQPATWQMLLSETVLEKALCHSEGDIQTTLIILLSRSDIVTSVL
jgi:hypothetical protein